MVICITKLSLALLEISFSVSKWPWLILIHQFVLRTHFPAPFDLYYSHDLDTRASRDSTIPLKPKIGERIPFKKSVMKLNDPRAQLDPSAPRPTRKFSFRWELVHKMLRISKMVGKRRQASWVGLKLKA